MQHKHQVETEGFEGHVVFNIPKYTERLKYIKQCGFKTGDDGQIVVSLEDTDSLVAMVEIAEKHVVEVNLTHKATGKVFQSMEALQYDNVCDALLSELSGKVLSGFSLGKV
jgi:hypothetical protein